MFPMKQVILKSNTKRLKQLITEFGFTWNIVKEETSVQCFTDCSTGIMIESIDKQHSRWVRPTDIERL